MNNSQYQMIRTVADIEKFQDISNGLHDGHITRVEYVNSGITGDEYSRFYDYSKRSLLIHVMVTSLPGLPVFELVFHEITEWQVNVWHFSDMIGFSILFLENGLLLWADDISPILSDLKKGSYVVAESIQYRRLPRDP